MKQKEDNSVQKWLPFEKILNNGIIKINEKEYVKIIKIYPINFNLKSELEKEAILNSYKTFLKTCTFDFQILIQSNKVDLSNHIKKIENQSKKENNSISEISKKYIEYVNKLNREKKSSSKNFFIILKYKNDENHNNETYIIQELNEQYFKIKDNLSRCGNIVQDYSEKEEIKKILYSFFNTRMYFNYL